MEIVTAEKNAEKLGVMETEPAEQQPSAKKSVKGYVCGAIFCLLAILGMLLGYFLYVREFGRRVNLVADVCKRYICICPVLF
jgi:hypothetical protein